MRWTCALALALAFRVTPAAAQAETAVPVSAPGYSLAAEAIPAVSRGQRIYTLRELLRLARAHYPKIDEARAKLAFKKAQLREARLAPFGEFEVVGGVGVVPGWRGTTVYSPNSDAAVTDDMALAWQMGVEGVIPLWTFGKLSHLWDAAESNVELGRHEVEKEKHLIEVEVRRAFYGLQLARDSLLLIDDATGRLDKYIEDLEADVAAGEGDDIELLKVKMQNAELQARYSEASKSERIALAGLRFFTGLNEQFDIPDVPIEPIEHQLGPVGRYLEAARLFRPEINMARAGLAARKSQLALSKARYFPDIGAGITARVGRAPGVTNQRNPFAYDQANLQIYGAGLVLRWKLDFLPHSARVAQAQAQLEEVRAIERFALGGVATEVETAYAEVQDARRRLEAWAKATDYAKQWLIKVQQGIDLGLSDEEDIVEPSKEYALKKFNEMEATFQFNVALAKLSLATGWDGILDGN